MEDLSSQNVASIALKPTRRQRKMTIISTTATNLQDLITFQERKNHTKYQLSSCYSPFSSMKKQSNYSTSSSSSILVGDNRQRPHERASTNTVTSSESAAAQIIELGNEGNMMMMKAVALHCGRQSEKYHQHDQPNHRQPNLQQHSMSLKMEKFRTNKKPKHTMMIAKKYPNSQSGFYSPLLLLSFVLLFGLTCLITKLANAIKLQPEGREKFFWTGEQFVITCQNNNNIKNVKIRWHGPNGVPITEDRSQRIHAESSGPHGHRLVVMNATANQDDGQYKCTIGSTDDRTPRETTDFALRLLQATSFKDTPRHLLLPANSNSPAIIQCQVEFDSNVSSGLVTWYKNRTPIDMLNDTSIQMSEYDPGRQLSQLSIFPLKREHEGVYTCQAMAVTTKLSKISELNIQLEVNYAPSFDTSKQTIWVESGRSVANRLAHQQQHHHLPQQAPQQPAQKEIAHRNIFGPGANAEARPGRGRMGHPKHHQQYAIQQQQNSTGGSSEDSSALNQNVVRLELHCSCQANPAASIRWYSSANSKYVVQKGEPEYVPEQPTEEVDGHNTSSMLIINYNLEPGWEHQNDLYTCSATNKLGTAIKTFSIEQGDPPPAFNVAPTSKQYNEQTSLFQFILLGPNFDPESTQVYHQSDLMKEIKPPVDSFRIRAEAPLAHSAGSSSLGSVNSMSLSTTSSSLHRLHGGDTQQQRSISSYNKRQNEPSVTWSLLNISGNGLDLEPARHTSLQDSQPQNITINLGRLPSGPQRLFLEAHNAVGWSPNATFLGEYYIVSGASSSRLLTSGSSLHSMQLVSILLASSYLIMSMFQRNKFI